MKQALKTLGKAALAVVVLLLLAASAGVGYVWYSGQQETVVTSEAPVPAKRQVIKPTKTAENAPVGVAIQMLTSPVIPGSNAAMTVRTTAKASCQIKVEYNKVASTDSGLVTKPADEFGIVGWSWTVPSTAPLGKWPATVTCSINKKSAVVVGDLEVVKTLPEN